MKFRKAQWLIGYTILAMILSSCNLGATPVPTQDVGVIQTQAFEKVLTQVALASSPTPLPTDTPAPTSTLSAPPTFAAIGGSTINTTPFPFNTPQAGLTPLALSPVPTLAGMVPTITTENGCNNGAFISESAPYDGQVIDPSKPYEKSFTLMNTGACTWDEGYAFIFQPNYSTEGFKGSDILLKKTVDSTPAGDTITFVMKLTASHLPGEYIGSWKMRDDGGNYFGPLVYVKYIIGTPEEQASIKATAKAATAAADED